MWLKLRGNYRDAKRRHQKCVKKGAVRQQVKKWRFEKQMSFLDPFMVTGQRVMDDSDDNSKQFSLKNEHFENENECPPQLEPDNENVFQYADIEQLLTYGDKDDDGNRNHTELLVPSASSTSSAIHTKKKINIADLPSLLTRSMQKREEREQQRAEDRKKLLLEGDKTANDPLYSFFRSMYQSTRSMPIQYQHQVRAQVFQAVSGAEAKIMNMTTNKKEL